MVKVEKRVFALSVGIVNVVFETNVFGVRYLHVMFKENQYIKENDCLMLNFMTKSNSTDYKVLECLKC